jgi:hypothetical protein
MPTIITSGALSAKGFGFANGNIVPPAFQYLGYFFWTSNELNLTSVIFNRYVVATANNSDFLTSFGFRRDVLLSQQRELLMNANPATSTGSSLDYQTGSFDTTFTDSLPLPNSTKVYVTKGTSSIWRYDTATGTYDSWGYSLSYTSGSDSVLMLSPDGNTLYFMLSNGYAVPYPIVGGAVTGSSGTAPAYTGLAWGRALYPGTRFFLGEGQDDPYGTDVCLVAFDSTNATVVGYKFALTGGNTSFAGVTSDSTYIYLNVYSPVSGLYYLEKRAGDVTTLVARKSYSTSPGTLYVCNNKLYAVNGLTISQIDLGTMTAINSVTLVLGADTTGAVISNASVSLAGYNGQLYIRVNMAATGGTPATSIYYGGADTKNQSILVIRCTELTTLPLYSFPSPYTMWSFTTATPPTAGTDTPTYGLSAINPSNPSYTATATSIGAPTLSPGTPTNLTKDDVAKLDK